MTSPEHFEIDIEHIAVEWKYSHYKRHGVAEERILQEISSNLSAHHAGAETPVRRERVLPGGVPGADQELCCL